MRFGRASAAIHANGPPTMGHDDCRTNLVEQLTRALLPTRVGYAKIADKPSSLPRYDLIGDRVAANVQWLPATGCAAWPPAPYGIGAFSGAVN